jgi:hypothetical protein
LAKNLTAANIKKLEEEFKKHEAATYLESQYKSSCGIHSINNLFSRPGMVSALQVFELYRILENSGLNKDVSERNIDISKINEVLVLKNEASAHDFIDQKMGGVEFNVLSTLLNSWVVPAANNAGIEVGKFNRHTLDSLNPNACCGKLMIAHKPGHYFAIVPVISKEQNAGKTPTWEVRDSIRQQRISLSGFNALKSYLTEQRVDNALLES